MPLLPSEMTLLSMTLFVAEKISTPAAVPFAGLPV